MPNNLRTKNKKTKAVKAWAIHNRGRLRFHDIYHKERHAKVALAYGLATACLARSARVVPVLITPLPPKPKQKGRK